MTRFYSFILAIPFSLALVSCSVPEGVLQDANPVKQTAEAIFASKKTTYPEETLGIPPETSQPAIIETIPFEAIETVDTVTPVLTAYQTAEAHKSILPCNLAASGNPIDVTAPESNALLPLQYFSKTWRLVNAGSCDWSEGYGLVWFSGESFNSPAFQPLKQVVAAGEQVEVTIDLAAPGQPGEYQGFWKLRSPEGQLFGIGPSGDAPFGVRVMVVETNTPTPETSATPSASPSPTSQVVASGQFTLTLGQLLDLDAGVITKKKDEGDLLLAVAENGQLLLVPQNDTRILFAGLNQPAEWECRLGVLSEDPIDLSLIQEGSYLCYRSSRGLPGYVILQTGQLKQKILNLGFVTWFIP